MPRILILIITFEFSFLFVCGQEKWKLKFDKEGIKIYSSPFSDSRINALKVVCTVKARLSQMAAVLLDIDSQDHWFYHTKSSILHQVSSSELLYYAVINLPWPFTNRDYVAHLKVSQDPDTKIMTMSIENVWNYVPLKQNLVRVVRSFGKWVVSPVGKDSIRIEFTLFVDPAGEIPFWLINTFSTLAPFETFKILKTFIKRPDYANAFFAFITD